LPQTGQEKSTTDLAGTKQHRSLQSKGLKALTSKERAKTPFHKAPQALKVNRKLKKEQSKQ
jgi:hypothetical protein